MVEGTYHYANGLYAFMNLEHLNELSVLLYIIVMYLLVKLVIDKHTLNISLLKVFGYDDNEINKLYLSGTFWTVLISILIALPLDYQLMQLI